MKVAVIGSRSLCIDDLSEYIPSDCTEIISGGAKGIDSCAAEYAISHSLILTEILPDYNSYGKAAPIVRNKKIVDLADLVISFWDGRSKGTLSVINYCRLRLRELKLILMDREKQELK